MVDSFLQQDYDVKVETKDGVFYLKEPKAKEIIDYIPLTNTPMQLQGAQRETMYKIIEKFIVKVERNGKILDVKDIDIRELRISTLVKLNEAINKLLDVAPNE
jgi:hypothetical protein